MDIDIVANVPPEKIYEKFYESPTTIKLLKLPEEQSSFKLAPFKTLLISMLHKV